MKHALLRLGPNTTRPSSYLPSLRFSPLSVSLTNFLLLSPVLSTSRLLKSLLILDTSHILYHRRSVTFTNPSGCVFIFPSVFLNMHTQFLFKCSLHFDRYFLMSAIFKPKPSGHFIIIWLMTSSKSDNIIVFSLLNPAGCLYYWRPEQQLLLGYV